MADASVRRDVERAITKALARKGLGGTVVVQGSIAELHGVHETPIGIDVGDWVEQWNLLPEDMRSRRAEAAATRFLKALGAVRGDAPTRRPLPIGRMATFLSVVLLFGALTWWLREAGFFGLRDAETPSSSATAAPAPADVRARRACEAARKRLYAGASIDLDTSGWVAELWLARRRAGLGDHDAVAEAAAEARRALDADGRVTVRKVDEGDLSTAIVTFEGGLVRRFFEASGRERFVDFATHLAEETEAHHAALYGRCAHLEVQDVGAWYFGRDDIEAVISLWLTAGSHSEEPIALEPASLQSSATKAADGLAAELRAAGARRVQDERGVSLRFPLGGPTRAAQVSRRLEVQ